MDTTDGRRRAVRGKLRASDGEWTEIRRRAAAARLPVMRYVREIAAGAEIREPRSRTTQEMVVELARVGNNLNQLARLANLNEELPEAAQLGAALQEVLDVVRRIT